MSNRLAATRSLHECNALPGRVALSQVGNLSRPVADRLQQGTADSIIVTGLSRACMAGALGRLSRSTANSVWVGRLERFVDPFLKRLKRCEQRQHAKEYVAGLLSDVERKNAESIMVRAFGKD